MKTCPNCHFNNESNTQFCVDCGTNIKNIPNNQTATTNSFEVRFWESNQNVIFCDEYFVSGKMKEKKFFIFQNTEELHFPIEKISSIRFLSGANATLAKTIFAVTFLFSGIYFLFLISKYSSNAGTNFLGIVSLIIGWILAFSLFKKVNQMIITTSNDKEKVVIKEFSKNSKLQPFVEAVQSQIIKASHK